MFKKILLVLLLAFVIIQFIQPRKNKSAGPQPFHISRLAPVPENVNAILSKACNDCHTNNTEYPWYARIQPVAWWLDKHIRDGKEHLNFDEYTNHNARYQFHKMEETIEMIKEGEMPLKSYTWGHKEANLSGAEKTAITNWANAVMDVLRTHYPVDSLIRK